MPRDLADRSILLGAVAVQMNLLTLAAMGESLRLIKAEDRKELAEIWLQNQAITLADLQVAKEMIAVLLDRHHDDIPAALRALGPMGTFRKYLERWGHESWKPSLGLLQLGDSEQSLGRYAGEHRFTNLKPHAEGGSGVVYLAEDREIPRQVALKRIKEKFEADPKVREQFVTEAEITGFLEHPGIVPIYSFGLDARGMPFYVMRFINGPSLKDEIVKFFEAESPQRDPSERALAQRNLLRRLIDICNVIEFSHSRSYMHRDIKPGNIILGEFGETFMLDWGLARKYHPEDNRKVAEAVDIQSHPRPDDDPAPQVVHPPTNPDQPPGPTRPIQPDAPTVAVPGEAFGNEADDELEADSSRPTIQAAACPQAEPTGGKIDHQSAANQPTDFVLEPGALPTQIVRGPTNNAVIGNEIQTPWTSGGSANQADDQTFGVGTQGNESSTLEDTIRMPGSINRAGGTPEDPTANEPTIVGGVPDRLVVSAQTEVHIEAGDKIDVTVTQPDPRASDSTVAIDETQSVPDSAVNSAPLNHSSEKDPCPPGVATPPPIDNSAAPGVEDLALTIEYVASVLPPEGEFADDFDETRRPLYLDETAVIRSEDIEAGRRLVIRRGHSRVQEEDQVVGTIGYMSPEQARGKVSSLTASTDIYSLGATLYHALTGQTAFGALDAKRTKVRVMEVIKQHARNDYPPPRSVNEMVPRALEAICLKAMRAVPEERYASARELSQDLENWLADEPVSAYPDPWHQRAKRWIRRHKTMVASGTAVVAAVLVCGVIGSLVWSVVQTRYEAKKRVDNLDTTRIENLPTILRELEDFPTQARELLSAEDVDPAKTPDNKVIARAKFLPNSRNLEMLVRRFLDAGAEALPVFLQVMEPNSREIITRLQREVTSARLTAEQRFHAVCGLTHLGQLSDLTRDHDPALDSLVSEILTRSEFQSRLWTQELMPLQSRLAVALGARYQETERGPVARQLAARNLVTFATAEHVPLLVDLLQLAGTEEFEFFMDFLEREPTQAQRSLTEARDRLLKDDSFARQLNPPSLPKSLLDQLEAAHGMATTEFAMCQTLPMLQVQPLCDALGKQGYRPIRMRPNMSSATQAADLVSVAILWRKDEEQWKLAKDKDQEYWKLAIASDASTIQRLDAQWRMDDFEPIEVAGLVVDSAGVTGPEPRYFVVWAKRTHHDPERQVELVLGSSDTNHKREKRLDQDGYQPIALQVMREHDGRPTWNSIWSPMPMTARRQLTWGFEPLYEGWREAQYTPIDLSVVETSIPSVPRPDPTRELERAVAAFDEAGWNLDLVLGLGQSVALINASLDRWEDALRRRAQAASAAGQFEKAVADLKVLVRFRQGIEDWGELAVAQARSGQMDPAKATLIEAERKFPKSRTLATVSAYSAMIEFAGSHHEEGLRRCREYLNGPDVDSLGRIWFAGMLVRATTQAFQANNPQARQILEETYRVIDRSLDQGDFRPTTGDIRSTVPYFYLGTSDDNLATANLLRRLSSWRGLPVWSEVVRHWGLDRARTAIWESSRDQEPRLIRGDSLKSHLDACRELAKQGFLPLAIAVTAPSPAQADGPGGPQGKLDGFTAESSWVRPLPPRDASVLNARRLSQIGIALIRLGLHQDASPLWQFRPDPGPRVALVERLGEFSGNERSKILDRMIEQLEAERDRSKRFAMLLSLGQFRDEDWSPAQFSKALGMLIETFKNDPDPGIHAASRWMLRRFQEAQARQDEKAQARGDQEAQARSKSSPPISLEAIEKSMAGQPLRPGYRWYVDALGLTMNIPPYPASFWMGSVTWESGHEEKEARYEAQLSRPYSMSATEIPVALFEEFLRERDTNEGQTAENPVPRPGRFANPDAECPILQVRWTDAADFCRWGSAKLKLPISENVFPKLNVGIDGQINVDKILYEDATVRLGLRLPTEEEWEYGVRAGTITARPFGDDPNLLMRYAWFHGDSNSRSHPVGRLKPNDFGFHDMLGNAEEWCLDTSAYYPSLRWNKGTIPTSAALIGAKVDARTARGGHYDGRSDEIRSAYRAFLRPTISNLHFGFRVARTLSKAEAEIVAQPAPPAVAR